MSLPRLDHATHIADQLNELAAKVKTRSRASLTEAKRLLETIARRFFNSLYGWELVNLNTEQTNYPAADLGDRGRRIAIQVTNEGGGDKITHTAVKAVEHNLGAEFDRLIIFFLLPKKPGFPKKFTQPANGPHTETWDIKDLLEQLQERTDIEVLARAARVLDEEMGKISAVTASQKLDITRIVRYAPTELIGREDEMALLNDTWAKAQSQDKPYPHIVTFVALGARCPMRLFLTDIHLYRTRLFGTQQDAAYPWKLVAHDLAEAERLIQACGYGRRKEELEDAKRALLPSTR